MATDFTPLSSGDPFPADWQGIAAYGREVAATGALIAESVRLLRRCADENNWETESADAFRERAEELAGDIDKSRERYENVGAKLVEVSGALHTAETNAGVHAYMARLEEDAAGGSVQEPGVDPEGLPVPLTSEQTQANGRREAARDEIARRQRLFDEEETNAREAADEAARAIRGYLDDDVKDSWWDRNAGWLRVVTQVLSVIIAIAAIVMLTVATGGTIWIVAAVVATAAGLISMGINIGLAQSGNGSWWSVAFDFVGLLTLGTGGLLTRALGRSFPALRAGMAEFRGMQAFVGTFRGWRLTVGNALSRVPLTFIRSRGLSMIAGLTDDAFDAMNLARNAALQAPDVARLSAILTGGRQTATDFAHARDILTGLRGLSGIPAQLAPDAAVLLDDAVRIRNQFAALTALQGINSVNSVGQAVYDGLAGDGVTAGNATQILVDVVGRLR